jgi:hypothetical protein
MNRPIQHTKNEEELKPPAVPGLGRERAVARLREALDLARATTESEGDVEFGQMALDLVAGFTEVRRGCPPFQGWEESPLQLLLNKQAFDLVFLSGAPSLPREIGEIGRTVRGRKAPVVTVHRWRLNLEAQLGPPGSCHPTARGGHRQEPRGGNRDPEPRSRDAMISIMGSASPSQGQAACFSWRFMTFTPVSDR